MPKIGIAVTVMALSDLTCNQNGCPFPGVQRCLEAFENIAECPHVANIEDFDSGPDDETDEPAPNDVAAEDAFAQTGPTAVSELMIELGGAVALSMEEASDFLARESGNIVLVAGPVGSGKTTLVVELYARFLYGPFANATFGGSETLRALDSRHFPALEPSGSAMPSTDRTQDEDVRLLHLKLSVGGSERHLLFSDVRGEMFENIVDGVPVIEELPMGPRVDRCLLVIDGERAADPRQRDVVFTDSKQLAGGLRAEGGLSADTPMAVLCTKWDRVPVDRRDGVLEQAKKIAAFAASVKDHAEVLTLSVRPGPPESAITGLTEVLTWAIDSGARPE